MTPGWTGHIDDTRLAAIADGSVATGPEGQHLTECRTCAAVHAELTRLRVASVLGDTADVPAELLAAGHRFVDDQRPRPRAVRRRPGLSPWRRGTLRVAPALAAIAVLLVLVGRMISPGVELPETVRLALVEESVDAAGLVHPLVAGERASERVASRGSSAVAPPILDQLRDRADEDAAPAEAVAAYVAGLQASEGQHRFARDVLDQARDEFPDDETLLSLEIYQLSLEGKTDELEQRLRAMVERRPRDRVARLNLAILLTEQGGPGSYAAALGLVRDFAKGDGDTVIEIRTRQILARKPR